MKKNHALLKIRPQRMSFTDKDKFLLNYRIGSAHYFVSTKYLQSGEELRLIAVSTVIIEWMDDQYAGT